MENRGLIYAQASIILLFLAVFVVIKVLLVIKALVKVP